jgi:hypothetical protein
MRNIAVIAPQSWFLDNDKTITIKNYLRNSHTIENKES